MARRSKSPDPIPKRLPEGSERVSTATLEEGVPSMPHRPASLAQTVRAHVGEFGESLVAGMVEIWKDPKVGKRDKIEAGKWLADRGFGRSVETAITLEASAGAVLHALPDSDLAGYVRTYLAPRIERSLPGQAVVEAEPGHGNTPNRRDSED